MIGGRSWLAWPAGLLCAGVVAGLVVLAAPALPATVRYVGDVLRAGTSAQATSSASAPKPLAQIGTALTDDCNSLYPADLWLELTVSPHTVLTQNLAPPPTSARGVVAAAHPAVRMTCQWRDANGDTITTTLADLDAAGIPVVKAGLTGQDFSCRPSGTDGVRCSRSAGGAVETEVVRGTVWLSTLEQGWHPSAYTDRLVARLWP